jgi:amidohydrolase
VREEITELTAAREHELIAFRRRLHAHPELSGAEEATTEEIFERLRVSGLEPVVLQRGTGLVCDIAGDTDGPLIALRADIDALAMTDLTETEYRSRVEGVAHACGHDVHTAVVLGAGLVLRALHEIEPLPCRVRLIFEPAEEAMPGGALDVIEEGWLDGVTRIFGVHCDPKIDLGQVGVRAGPITASSDLLAIELRGPGGHTARPHLTVDLVAVMGRVLTDLPALIVERINSDEQVTVVFGAAHTGDAANVIPARAIVRGSVRTVDVDAWDAAEKATADALSDLLSDSGAEWELDYQRGIPAVVNDVAATAILGAAAAKATGVTEVIEMPRSMGGDTFAWYAQRVPAAYARLGTHAGDGPRGDLHASTFDVDERCISIGVETLVRAVLSS